MSKPAPVRVVLTEDVIDVDYPSLDAILERAAQLPPLQLARDFTWADWSDTSGDFRWRSLDPTYEPGPPLKQEWR